MVNLEARNVVKHFQHDKYRLKALGGINLKVEDGEFVCLVGPSGCGKSTFLRIVAGMDTMDEGEILFDGKPVAGTGAGEDHGVSGRRPVPLAQGI